VSSSSPKATLQSILLKYLILPYIFAILFFPPARYPLLYQEQKSQNQRPGNSTPCYGYLLKKFSSLLREFSYRENRTWIVLKLSISDLSGAGKFLVSHFEVKLISREYFIAVFIILFLTGFEYFSKIEFYLPDPRSNFSNSFISICISFILSRKFNCSILCSCALITGSDPALPIYLKTIFSFSRLAQ